MYLVALHLCGRKRERERERGCLRTERIKTRD